MYKIDIEEILVIGSIFVIPVCLWGLSRLSSSLIFRRCNTAFLISYSVILFLHIVPLICRCGGSPLNDGYRNCIYIDDWFANKIGTFAFYGFFLIIVAYVFVMILSGLIFLYKKTKNSRSKFL